MQNQRDKGTQLLKVSTVFFKSWIVFDLRFMDLMNSFPSRLTELCKVAGWLIKLPFVFTSVQCTLFVHLCMHVWVNLWCLLFSLGVRVYCPWGKTCLCWSIYWHLHP